MSKSLTYAFGIAVLLVASMLVVAEDKDPCALLNVNNTLDSCKQCVLTVANKTANKNCSYVYNVGEDTCVSKPEHGESEHFLDSVGECIKTFGDDTIPITTTATPTSSNGTTTSPPTTIPTTTTTVTPTTNATTQTPTTPTTSPSTTTSSTTPVPTTTASTPTKVTTSTVSPSTSSTTAKPEPRGGGGMSFASFFGGIVFTLCMSGLGYLIWRFYRARMDRNYHTFANPTF